MSDLITITLPDGKQVQAPRGKAIHAFIKESIGQGLARAALAAKLDGRKVDLSAPLTGDAKLEVITEKSPEGLDAIRHSAAHVLASAVQRIYPDAQVTIGPVIEDGFYYDFYRPDKPFTEEDLRKFEHEIQNIVAEDAPFKRTEMPVEEAISFFEGKGEKFKAEIIRDLRDQQGVKTVSLYEHAGWVDLCRGPHVPSTGRVGAIKLMKVSGAYWRGDSKNPMLQRIYGTAWRNQKELEEYLHRLDEAQKRDHRKLGRELELFMTHPFAPGAVFWLPKGLVVYNTLSQWMRELLLRSGYVEVRTPLLYKQDLWETSGHWENYRQNMFLLESEGEMFAIKSMNCPSHMLVFGSKRRSYRELPLRLHDQSVLHRNEPSGTLGGLTRVRQFSQDDAHIFLAEDEIATEVSRVLQLVDKVYSTLGLSYRLELSTRPPQRIGDDGLWDTAEAALQQALAGSGKDFKLNPGDGAFYGPKIDFHVTDSIGRSWQTATCQLDFNLPRRFGLTYVGADNAEHVPVVIHRAIFGSFERFIALAIEHFAGAFPTWLAPVQAQLVPVADRHMDYAREVKALLEEKGVRTGLDERGAEKLGAKIREAELQKVPLIIVLGDKEVAARGASPRRHGGKDLGLMPLDALVRLCAEEARPPRL